MRRRAPLEAQAGQVVIDVRAAGVNFVDGLICQGRYQIKPRTPFVPGSEVAGVVVATGPDVTHPAVGDRVVAMTPFGGYSGQALVPSGRALPMPDTIDFSQAAALIQSYGTAMFTLTRRVAVTPGDWVLVLGAGGGVGLAAVDVAVSLGCRVIAAASSEEKRQAALDMGAEAAIAYEEEDLKVRARELSGGGVDVVVDPVGGRQSEPALRALRVFGRFCVIGFAAGPIATVPLNQVLLNNRSVVGIDWGAWTSKDPEANRTLLDELLDMVAQGRLHPPRPHERQLDDTASALGDLIERRLAGKVVLIP